jgi:hypothetical protein
MKTPRFVLGLALVAIALVQSGCVSLINKVQKTFFSDDPSIYSPAPYISDNQSAKAFASLRTTFDTSLQAAQTTASTEKSLALFYAGIALIDYNYRCYIDAATHGRASFATVADVTAIGLTTAATLVDPVGTKTILSGISTAVQGSRASVEKNFYQDIAIFVAISRMDSAREKVFKEITEKAAAAKADNLHTLTYSEVLIYLGQYYRAGTMLYVLASETDVSKKLDDVKDSQTKLATDLAAVKAQVEKQ